MFKFFKKKKQKEFTIRCSTDHLKINEDTLNFPCVYDNLFSVLGEPSRKINSSNEYLIWDEYGFLCSVNENGEILSLSVYQANNNVSEYVPKNGFNGKLFFEEDDITFKEFSKIGLGKIAIHRLGSESETRFGFSIGINNDYKS
ncbi:hypothetical protein ACOSP6_11410 [Tenacibaculum sp. MEBiC06402]|uniref:DUF7738 domain-containing protein n=1 Tax=unclassified Tenacibaculum TaxID=2635139 RepID=UPI003B9C036D